MAKSIRIAGPIPGPRSKALAERRAKAVTAGLSTAHPIFAAFGAGATITDVDGNTFLDFAGGIGVMNVGHAQPDVVSAVQEQAARLTHACFQVSGYEGYVAVAETLNRLAPGAFDKRALLVSTGAEAVENAVKFARAATKRAGVLCFERAFHGRTLLGMTLTGKVSPYKAGLGPFAPEVYRLPHPYRSGADASIPAGPGNPEGIEKSLQSIVAPGDLAAVIFEPVLGEGGFCPMPAQYAADLRAFCDKHGVVLIADEVQSGFARCGTMFATERLGVIPDLTTMAKSIAGGLPLAAVVGRASIMDAMPPGGVGGTYAGNPVACAAALAAIALLERLVAEGRAEAVGARLRNRLAGLQKDLPIIGEIRGLGPMLAIELVGSPPSRAPAIQETARVIAHARNRGLLLLSAGPNVIRFLTPLTITDAELDEGLDVVEDALRSAAAA